MGVVFLKNKPIDLSLRRKTPSIETSLLGNFIQPNLKIDDPYFSALPRLKSFFPPKKGPRLISPRRRAPKRNAACTILKSQERKQISRKDSSNNCSRSNYSSNNYSNNNFSSNNYSKEYSSNCYSSCPFFKSTISMRTCIHKNRHREASVPLIYMKERCIFEIHLVPLPYLNLSVYTGDGKYEGELKGGKREGQGTHVYAWGGIFTGDWKNDKKHGKGKISDKWGGDYDGEWVDDKKEGRGINLWSNGRRYDGQWKNDEMQGEGRWRWPDGRTFQGKFATDCPTDGLLLEGDDVYRVKYPGKTDIADPELKPSSQEKDASDEGRVFKRAATAWESRLKAQNNIVAVRASTAAARDEMAKLKREDDVAQQDKGQADKDAEEKVKLSSLAEQESAQATATAQDLEQKAAEARAHADKLAKLASERAVAAKKSCDAAAAATKKYEDKHKAKGTHVAKVVALEKELKEMQAILTEADPATPNICDVSLD